MSSTPFRPADGAAPFDFRFLDDADSAPSAMERVAQNQSLLQDAAQRTQSVVQNGQFDNQQVQQHRLALAQLAGEQNVSAARASADVAVADSTYQAAHDDAAWREANAADLASARGELPSVLDAINAEADPFRLRDAVATFHGRYSHLLEDPVLGDQYNAIDNRIAARLQARDDEFRARISAAAASFRPLVDPAFPERLADIRNSPYYALARLDPGFAQQFDAAARQFAALAPRAPRAPVAPDPGTFPTGNGNTNTTAIPTPTRAPAPSPGGNPSATPTDGEASSDQMPWATLARTAGTVASALYRHSDAIVAEARRAHQEAPQAAYHAAAGVATAGEIIAAKKIGASYDHLQDNFRDHATAFAEAMDRLNHGRWSEITDDPTAFQLGYQWVKGTDRTWDFTEDNIMGRQIVTAPALAKAIQQFNAQAAQGGTQPVKFNVNLGKIPEGDYLLGFLRDATVVNPAAAFHGSLKGWIEFGGYAEVDGKKVAIPVMVAEDEMSAVSGTRYPPFMGGYDSNARDRSVLPENPYGTPGPFSTFWINYRVKVAPGSALAQAVAEHAK